MRILLDTHILLWALYEEDKLSPEVKAILKSNDYQIYISVVSELEVSIKQSVGKLKLNFGFSGFLKRVDELNTAKIYLDRSHLLEYEKLHLHHRDPFDRLLIAQAKAEGLKIITSDSNFKLYDAKIIWNR